MYFEFWHWNVFVVVVVDFYQCCSCNFHFVRWASCNPWICHLICKKCKCSKLLGVIISDSQKKYLHVKYTFDTKTLKVSVWHKIIIMDCSKFAVHVFDHYWIQRFYPVTLNLTLTRSSCNMWTRNNNNNNEMIRRTCVLNIFELIFNSENAPVSTSNKH